MVVTLKDKRFALSDNGQSGEAAYRRRELLFKKKKSKFIQLIVGAAPGEDRQLYCSGQTNPAIRHIE